MYQTAILVLLYNKKISESKTLSTLAASDYQFSNAKLVIWNNGPKRLKAIDVSIFTDLGYQVQIVETINNESLAIIYNSFIRNNEAETYIFLDDDSTLNADYIQAASESESSVISMPIITSDGRVENPTINLIPFDFKKDISPTDSVLTIGSGLVIGRSIVLKLQKQFNSVFDERFYFYGVDTTFCHRLKMSNLVKNIRIIAGFEHSLSRLEIESYTMFKFRQKERSYDLGLTLKYYYSLPYSSYILSRVTLHIFKCTLLKKKRLFSLPLLFKAYLTGKHYKS